AHCWSEPSSREPAEGAGDRAPDARRDERGSSEGSWGRYPIVQASCARHRAGQRTPSFEFGIDWVGMLALISTCHVLAAVGLALGTFTAAQSVKVSAPMPFSPLANGENVFDSDFAGTRVVYRADQDVHGVVELYSAPRDGSQPAIKLSPVLATNETVSSFQVSPDGATVLFLTTLGVLYPYTLYRVPSDGSASAVLLATSVLKSPDALPFDGPRLTTDGTRFVYIQSASSSKGDLRVVPLAGGGARRLATDVDEFWLGGDGSRVVYQRSSGSQHFLMSVPLAGGTPVALSGAYGETDVHIRDDGWIVFSGNYPTGSLSLTHEIYAVPIDGSKPPVKLNSPLAFLHSVRAFELTPDGTRVVYVADQERLGVDELYVVPADGSV